jgi:hypothetical protein
MHIIHRLLNERVKIWCHNITGIFRMVEVKDAMVLCVLYLAGGAGRHGVLASQNMMS